MLCSSSICDALAYAGCLSVLTLHVLQGCMRYLFKGHACDLRKHSALSYLHGSRIVYPVLCMVAVSHAKCRLIRFKTDMQISH